VSLIKHCLGIAALLLLTSCGTASGILKGTGEVLEGMANDARSVSTVFE